MKTLSIIISNLEIGGAEKNAVIIANEFNKLGYDVEILLLQATGGLIKNLYPSIRVVDLRCKKKWMAFFKLLKYFFLNKKDAVLAFMFPITFFAASACKLVSPFTRIVLTERTTFSKHFFEKRNLNFGYQILIKIIMKLGYKIADSVVLVSKQSLEELKKFLGSKYLCKINFQIIYNPIDFFEEGPQESNLLIEEWGKDNAHKLLAVGRLIEAKNYPILINAFLKLTKTENVRLLILGDGPMRETLENLVQQYGLQNRVLMPGFIQNTKPFYQAANLYVLSSWLEGFPNVLLEALSYGLKIVSTDCASGPREILEDGKYGTLVAVNHVDEFHDAIKTKLYEEHDPLKMQSRSQVFSKEKTISQYAEVLLGAKCLKKETKCVE